MKENQELKDRLREICFGSDLDFYGVGPVERWSGAPVGHRPTELLSGARSVIVVGIKIPEGCIRENMAAYRGEHNGILPYMVYGYNMLNDMLEAACGKMAECLNQQGYQVFLPPASVGRDEYEMMGIISNRHSAVAAGLAEFGMNGLALTPEAGPRVRWSVIITDAKLPEDPLYHGPKLCEECYHCAEVCPTQAFNREEKWQFKIGDKDCTYCKLSRYVCRTAQTGLSKGSSGRLQQEVDRRDFKVVDDWRKMVRSDNKWNRLERVAAMCGRCMIECPVGRERREKQ